MAPSYPDTMIVREARQRYFDANGLTESEYRSGSFQVRIGPIPLSIPNTKARVRAVMLHDLHHVATGYDTTWRGEAEIGAWELAGGCGRHWFAWLAKLSVVAIGIAIAPRRTHRAFARGRSCDNLFRREFGEDLLGLTVAELRRGIGLSTQP